MNQLALPNAWTQSEIEWSRTYKGLSNDLALLLRLPDALEAAKEKLGAINHREVDSEMLLKSFLDLLALVETH